MKNVVQISWGIFSKPCGVQCLLVHLTMCTVKSPADRNQQLVPRNSTIYFNFIANYVKWQKSAIKIVFFLSFSGNHATCLQHCGPHFGHQSWHILDSILVVRVQRPGQSAERKLQASTPSILLPGGAAVQSAKNQQQWLLVSWPWNSLCLPVWYFGAQCRAREKGGSFI